jgi:chemotaxis methyl-accepting protein methylase
MRTTIDIDEHLLLYAKQKAAENHGTLKNIMEDALREYFSRHATHHNVIKLETFQGVGLKPGVDLNNSQSLNDIMDGW